MVVIVVECYHRVCEHAVVLANIRKVWSQGKLAEWAATTIHPALAGGHADDIECKIISHDQQSREVNIPCHLIHLSIPQSVLWILLCINGGREDLNLNLHNH